MTDAERAEVQRLRKELAEVWQAVTDATTAGVELLADRDRLAAEVARLRAELERAAYAYHSAHLGWEGPCCCPAHKIAAAALEPK